MVKYRIIGDDSATTFFDIDQNFGNVTLKSSVNFDTTSNYKVIIFGSNSFNWLSANLKSLFPIVSDIDWDGDHSWRIDISNGDVFLQIRVQAYDGGLPSLSATATVDVLVQRNLYSPVFSVLNYEVTINENAALGVPFIYVNATDADIRVCCLFRTFNWC